MGSETLISGHIFRHTPKLPRVHSCCYTGTQALNSTSDPLPRMHAESERHPHALAALFRKVRNQLSVRDGCSLAADTGLPPVQPLPQCYSGRDQVHISSVPVLSVPLSGEVARYGGPSPRRRSPAQEAGPRGARESGKKRGGPGCCQFHLDDRARYGFSCPKTCPEWQVSWHCCLSGCVCAGTVPLAEFPWLLEDSQVTGSS